MPFFLWSPLATSCKNNSHRGFLRRLCSCPAAARPILLSAHHSWPKRSPFVAANIVSVDGKPSSNQDSPRPLPEATAYLLKLLSHFNTSLFYSVCSFLLFCHFLCFGQPCTTIYLI